MAELKGYLRDNFQDMSSICPDPMKIGATPPAYVKYTARPLPPGSLAACPDTDEGREMRLVLITSYKDNITATNKKLDKQELDKQPAYEVIRSMCSIALNAILAADKEFMEMRTNDPLILLNIIKRLVTTKCDGHVEHDRTDALTEWYNLAMSDIEDIASYSKRASKAIERMKSTGVTEAQQPTDEQQAFGYIKGLNSRVLVYAEYKNYLSNALETLKADHYPKTLALAIHSASRFHRGTKIEPTTGNLMHTTFTAAEATPNTNETSVRRFNGNCNYCGKLGHKESACRSKLRGKDQTVRVGMATEAEAPYYSTFSHMYDNDDPSPTRQCKVTIHLSQETTTQHGIRETEAIFDTGATGSIISCARVLTDIRDTPTTTFKGLAGNMDVTQMGTLEGVGRVYFDTRAGMSIISASECISQGNKWEFTQDSETGLDMFLLQTATGTYRFIHRDGLYIGDLAQHGKTRQAALVTTTQCPTALTEATTHPVQMSMVYTSHRITTTTDLEALYTTRQVKRSATARRFQAALGFPPDAKMIRALRAGTFMHSDILPEDVTRATHMWGPCIFALKGRTTREKPVPQPQGPLTSRRMEPQHMHCDLMFINKQAFLVSITQPVGVCQTTCLDNTSTISLRASIRRMFGNLKSRRIDVVRFTSDNEKGIAALFGDMAGMGVEAITVGPGQHDHVIERMIRQLKETIRSTIASLPFQAPDIIVPHLVLSCTRKLLLFPSSTRTDRISPFEAFYGRKANAVLDIGPPFGTYCQVSSRTMTNGMEPRTYGCIYLEPRNNGTGTHSFLRLDTRTVIGANHMQILPFPPNVATFLNDWAKKNKHHVQRDPVFTYHDEDITMAPGEEDEGEEDGTLPPDLIPLPATQTNTSHTHNPGSDMQDTVNPTIPMDYTPDIALQESDPAPVEDMQPQLPDDSDEPVQHTVDREDDTPSHEEAEVEDPGEDQVHRPVQIRPRDQLEQRQPSTRIRKPVTRLNLMAKGDMTTDRVAFMTVSRAMKLFPEKTATAMHGEVKSLLGKHTFSGVHLNSLTYGQRKKILRSNMNVVEKYLPTLDETGNRAIEKVKARLCVDGRAQDRADYHISEIAAPTANIASLFTVAQIAASEGRHVMVGDVGTAYLNASMPTSDPERTIHMSIDPRTAAIVMEQDASFKQYRTRDGGLIVRLDKALYGCIESARLWNDEITSKLVSLGFEPNPRDKCVFNKLEKGVQTTIAVYVDDLMITSTNLEAIHEVEIQLRGAYGEFRTSMGPVVTYLGCTWDFGATGVVSIKQTGMIQDLVTSREVTHTERGGELKGNPSSPAAGYLFERTMDSPLLSAEHATCFHKDVATALYLGNRTRPDIVTTLGELCKRVKAPTEEDDRKLDRLIAYLRATRDIPLTLGCTFPPRVTVSIDAAYQNREEKKSTTGMCMTLGTGVFTTASKVQKTVTKSSTEAEIVAVADGMNAPLWLRDFISYQGYDKQPVKLEQDNQSCITLLQKGESSATATKYIDVKMFWISDYIRRGEVTVQFVPTGEMTADYYTKPLQGALFKKMASRIQGCEAVTK